MSSHAKHADTRRSWLHPRGVVALVALGVIVAGAGLGVRQFLRGDHDGSASQTAPCAAQAAGRTHHLRVFADPVIAESVAKATHDLSPWLDKGDCLQVTVEPKAAGEVAAAVARPSDLGFGGEDLPDAWIPDTSRWLALARTTATGRARLAGQEPVVIARSPIVVAANKVKAEDAGWPDSQPTWSSMLSTATREWHLASADPHTDAPGLAALFTAQRGADLAAIGRRVELHAFGEDLPAAAVAAGTFDAVPSSEAAVIAANAGSSGDDVVAVYDDQIDSSLDYTFVPLVPDAGGISKAKSKDLDVVRAALSDPRSQDLLMAAGLRSAEGTLSADFGQDQGVLDQKAGGAFQAPTQRMSSLLQEWSLLGRRSRLLIVVDRSASMSESLPGGTATKADLAERSVQALVDASSDDSDLGLWTFTAAPGAEVTTTVTDVGPVGAPESGDSGITKADFIHKNIESLEPEPGGGTPLYRAVQAAYQSAMDDYAYGRYNAVVVVTDGRDDDQTRKPIPVSTLLDSLRRQYDGMRPVPIIALAYGTGADVTTLRQITGVTGGQVFVGLDQRGAQNMLERALANE